MNTISVSQLNRYVLSLLESDHVLSDLSIKGEISSFKKYSSGHLYFTLKDEKSSISCVMFKGNAEKLTFEPEDGISVIAGGKASLYERDGKFQLYITKMVPEGKGDLFAAFQILKEKLSREGLFDETNKKKIPFLPERIGVITSPSGAVIRDIINVCSRRYPNFDLLLYPSLVQGEMAAKSIIQGIKIFNEKNLVDVIIVGRGGGSIEDLWCFNDENLARAIFESEIPVVSAVGHETDFTICDFTADMRAPTPSAAAELVVPEKSSLVLNIGKYKNKLSANLLNKLNYQKLRYSQIANKKIFISPDSIFEKYKQNLMNYEDLLDRNIKDVLKMKKDNLSEYLYKMDSMSPMKVLRRGYSIVNIKGDSTPVNSVDDVNEDTDIVMTFFDGKVSCMAKSVKKEKIIYGKK